MDKKQNNGRRLIRNDIFLILFVLLIAAAVIFYLYVLRDAGDSVRITVDGREYGVYSLSEDRTEDIYSEDRSCHNRLVIRGGKAFMEYASCPDGICVAHSEIFRSGESIVCLPNRVVISVVTDGGDNSPDVVI